MALAKRVSRDWHRARVSSLTLETIQKYTASRHVVTQQIARDLTNLVTIMTSLPADHVVMSKLSTLFDRPVKVDRKLPFLDEYTRQALRQGARDYQRSEGPHVTKATVPSTRDATLRFETYQAPATLGNAKSSASIFEQTAPEESSSIYSTAPSTPAMPSGPGASLKQVSGPWSSKGYGANNSPKPATPTPANYSAPRDQPSTGTTTPPRASSGVKREPVPAVNQPPSQEELMAALLFEGASKKKSVKKRRTPATSPTSTNDTANYSPSSSPLATINSTSTSSSPLNTNQGLNQGSVDSLLSFDFTQPVLAANNSSSVSIFDAFAPSPETKELQTLIAPISVSPNLARQLDTSIEDDFDLPNLETTPFMQLEVSAAYIRKHG
jgi:hypothetical protein